MKRIVLVLSILILLYVNIFTAFSFDVDGVDSGTEWNGATVYTLINGESNCKVDFGLVKVKFDYDTDALNFCFLFSDPDFTPDNPYAGISLSVDNNSPFEITSSVGKSYDNILPHSFDGAVIVNDTKGATCEIRVGFKSGLPETINCSVRYIDSQGSYSNYYEFKVVNENYKPQEVLTVSSAADNNDIKYNYKTTKSKTTAKEEYTIKTSPPYSYTGRTKKPTTQKLTTQKPTEASSVVTSKTSKTKKETVKVYYYEKEVYISEVYISEKSSEVSNLTTEININTSDYSVISDGYSEASQENISLSKGTKYKKAVACAGLASFTALAFFGVYTAKKGAKS